MRVSDFDYELPADRIAQRPATCRDGARLMVLGLPETETSDAADRSVSDLPDLLHQGDLLVLNDTRVFPARLRGRKESGGQVEVLLLHPEPGGPANGAYRQNWLALLGASRMPKAGQRLFFGSRLQATLVGPPADGETILALESVEGVHAAIERLGEIPLPPYIERAAGPNDGDRDRYQTIYARESGATAAPTAGLHFTHELLARLAQQGVARADLTLHVGLGTFRPVREERVEDHRMHSEFYRIPQTTAEAVERTRQAGGRVVAVGTTVVRALEHAGRTGAVAAGEGWCDLFISPGFRFRKVDLLLTNFHLPRSSLLMLVAAFAGRRRILSAYREAVRRGYRFYSYGDAMLLARNP